MVAVISPSLGFTMTTDALLMPSPAAAPGQNQEVLASRDVVVERVDFALAPEMHARYKIEAVPAIVVADYAGVVKAGFLGPIKAQDLWAAVAECRDPGSSPGPCEGKGQA